MSHDGIRRGVCFMAVCLLAGVRPAKAGGYRDLVNSLNAKPPSGSRFRSDLEAKLATLVSAYREGEGKEPVAPDDTFLDAARAHAADMTLNGFLSHSSSSGLSFQSRMRALVGDVTRYPSIGENAARDTQDTPVDDAKVRAILDQWINSRAHRRVMVNRSFHFVSTGIIQRDNKIWAVQIFFGTPREKGLFQ